MIELSKTQVLISKEVAIKRQSEHTHPCSLPTPNGHCRPGSAHSSLSSRTQLPCLSLLWARLLLPIYRNAMGVNFPFCLLIIIHI